jgi:hypothetical protein
MGQPGVRYNTMTEAMDGYKPVCLPLPLHGYKGTLCIYVGKLEEFKLCHEAFSVATIKNNLV